MLKKSLIAIIAMTFCAWLSISANASELIEACVKYQRADESWSNGYKVKAFLLTGSELNNITDSSHFDYYSHYMFIPWDNEWFTLLNIDFRGQITFYENDFEDQNSRKWRVKEGWSFCY